MGSLAGHTRIVCSRSLRAALAVAFSIPLAMGAAGCDDIIVAAKLQAAADEINKKTPLKLDEFTTLERADVGDNKTLSYVYTAHVELTEAQKQFLKNTVTQNVRSDKGMKQLLDLGVTFRYVYYDEQKRLVLDFSINREAIP